jgi:drug/metabolite transporter (DMT)-like permease
LNRPRVLAYIAFAIVCLVWGTTYLFIRIGVETIPPLLLTGSRYLAAGGILLAILKFRGESLPRDKRTIAELALIGALMVGGGNLAVVWAEQYVPSGMAALLVATAPFWAAIMEANRKDGERIGIFGGLGMLVGFIGVALLVLPGARAGHFQPGFLTGALVIQVGALCWQYGMVRGKYYLHGVSFLPSVTLQMLIGGALVTTVGFLIGEGQRLHFTPRTAGALIYLTIFGSVIAYSSFVYALAHISTTRLSLYAYINPVVAVILGWLVLGERLTWVSMVAMFIILGGVAIVQTGRARKAALAVVEPLKDAA